MASTFTDLGLELMATGENAGTWGTKTNANLNLAEQLLGGFKIQTLNTAGTGANTTNMLVADGALTGAAQNRVIILGAVSPQAITGNKVVTFPLLAETFYFIKNSTSGAYTVQLKAISGSGATVTFSATDKGYKAIYLDGVATNTGVIEIPLAAADGVTLTGTQTLTNKTLTNPVIANILSVSNGDVSLAPNGTGHATVKGNDNPGIIQLNCEQNTHGQQIKSQPHSTNTTNVMLLPEGADSTLVSRVSTDTLTNKTLTSPTIGTKIADTNGNELLLLTATGSAVNEFTLANASTGNGPTLSATGETNVGININPKGTGVFKSGSGAVKIAGLETIWVPASAMYGSTTNPADAAQIETTAGRPDLKTFDFDPDTQQHTQFSVAFPKSWNEGTVTYQVYWSPSTTNTGNCFFGMNGVAVGDGDTIDVVFGTQQTITDAGIGTVEDQQVTSVSSAITIAGSPAVDQQTYFQFFRVATSGTDTFTGDARVLGVKIFFTTDAANDA